MKTHARAFCLLLLVVPALAQKQQPVLAATPPMGWNSWNKFHMKIDDAMVSSGMKAAGYQYINLDEGWEGTRNAQGNLAPNRASRT